jgi:phosphate transport system substrate-binding protein
VTALTTTQLRDIYAGRLTNWKELGGRDLPIRMVSRVGRDSGSRRTFREKVLAGDQELGISSDDCKTTDDPVARHHRCEVGTTEELLTRVNGIDGAIGYAELGASRKYPAMSVMSLDGSSLWIGSGSAGR